MPIRVLCMVMEERNILQREGWKTKCIARPHLGCGRWHQKQPAEAATSNSRCSQPSGNVRCCRGWRFRKMTSSTVQCNLKATSRSYVKFILQIYQALPIYNFIPYLVRNPYPLFYVPRVRNFVTVQNRIHVYTTKE